MLSRFAWFSVVWSLMAVGCASWVVPTGPASMRDAAVSDAAATDASAGCLLPNGTVCPFGTSCPAGDGCNSCSCTAGGPLACTTEVCTTTCRSNADCAPGLSCTGPAGCGTPWTCQPSSGCLTVVSTWCDCAGNTFTTPDGCPGRPFNHAGPCETPVADAGVCAPVGAVCNTGRDCCSGYCMSRGAPLNGCANPPPGTFGCGDITCQIGSEYCELTFSDVPTPDSATCRPLAASCGGAVRCDCVMQHICGGCRVLDDRTVSFQCPGG